MSCSSSLPFLVTNFASPKGIEIKTKWLSQAACRRHKLCNFCARLNHFLGVYGKNEDCHLLCFSMLFVVVYFVFSVDAFFMAKIAKQNRFFFGFFFKKAKTCLIEMALALSFFKLWGFLNQLWFLQTKGYNFFIHRW